jgi:ABC-type transport system involved in cytochrome bd biosynthesis fused ATPase/permease subunit
MDDLLDAAGGRSVLLITHRPEGLERMDEILTLGGGAGPALDLLAADDEVRG